MASHANLTPATKSRDGTSGVARPKRARRATDRNADLRTLQRLAGNRGMGRLIDTATTGASEGEVPGVRDPHRARALRTSALLRRLGADLGLRPGDVAVRVESLRETSPSVAAPGFAANGVAHLDAATYDARSCRSLELLAHEVVHLAQ